MGEEARMRRGEEARSEEARMRGCGLLEVMASQGEEPRRRGSEVLVAMASQGEAARMSFLPQD
jgi:xanthine/CO dehydrogenase XdhC/CoxF family maturation factor